MMPDYTYEICNLRALKEKLEGSVILSICNHQYNKIQTMVSDLLEYVEAKDKVIKEYTGDISDGYHTFNELYHHRAILFSVICNQYPELAWKSLHHDNPDSPMYEGMFIVGIETPEGQATYHYNIDPYWDIFKVQELDKAPKWDGHTPDEAIRRISTVAPIHTGKCRFPGNTSIKPDGIHELDPCNYTEIEKHTNVVVSVSKCTKCGTINISWERTEDTEDIYYE